MYIHQSYNKIIYYMYMAELVHTEKSNSDWLYEQNIWQRFSTTGMIKTMLIVFEARGAHFAGIDVLCC